ncbi:MAG: site-2 protease family protein [Alphaproteobacteria bacterium]|nr:site-2 protease family protein [Alphaproteobacteria bacterium]
MALAEDKGAIGRFRLFGIDIRINASWLVIAVLVAWSLATGALPEVYKGLSAGGYWLMAALVVLGLALSIIFHEVAHTLVARAFGMQVDRITLFLFGGVADLKTEPPSALSELLMAAAGPAFSLVASLALAVAAGVGQAAHATSAAAALAYLATLNFVLAIFNMTPAFPLDGGRVLRAILWMITRSADRATRIAASVSGVIALAMIGFGLAGVLLGHGVAGLWWVLIGFFLRTAVHGYDVDLKARRALEGVSPALAMTSPLETVPAAATLDEFVEGRVYGSRHKVYPVMLDGACVGTIEADAVLSVPRAAWATTTVGDICAPPPATIEAGRELDAAALLVRMREQGLNHMLVLDEGQLVGMVTLDDLLKLVDVELKFRPPPRLKAA